VRGLNAGARELPRKDLDALTEVAKRFGAGGLVWAFVQDEDWRSPVAKFLSDDERAAIGRSLSAQPGDLLLIVAVKADVAATALGLDRIAAIVAGRDSIRDVIAFPKTASGSDLLTGAPSPVDEAQVSELGLKVTVPRG